MTEKKLVKYGVAAKDFTDHNEAADYTYTTSDGNLVPTPLIFPDNPYNKEVKNAHYVLDLGCGVGRNLPWIMENTEGRYVGLDPNESMLRAFHKLQGTQYPINVAGGRVYVVPDTSWFHTIKKFDVVVCTFVFQHIGFRPPAEHMNVVDITNEVRKYCHKDTVWIMYEHDFEEPWIERWSEETGIIPEVMKRNYMDIPELAHRGPHHLMIWKGN